MFQNTKQVIFKVTRGCNLSCKYCYVFNKDHYRGEIMSIDTFKFMLKRWFSETVYGDILAQGEDGIQTYLELIFHGGEPLSVGKERLARMFKIAHQIAREYNKVIQLNIQTNGVLIDEDWISLFNKYKIVPGISFDGFSESGNQRAAGESLINLLHTLKSASMLNGVLIVLHKDNYKNLEKDYDKLRNMGISSIKLNRAVDVTTPKVGESELTFKEVLDVSIMTIKYMFLYHDFQETNLYELMRRFMNQTSRGLPNDSERRAHCSTRYCGAGKNLIEVEPDGEIQFCGRNSTKTKMTNPGNIGKKDVLELQNIKEQLDFHIHKINSVVKHKCNLCPAQAICDGGCISFANQKYGEPKIDSITCGYFKGLHKWMSMNKEKISQYLGDNIPRELNSHYNL